jgi:hypothetical protein
MFFLTHAQKFKGPTWKNVVPQAQTVRFKCRRVKVKMFSHLRSQDKKAPEFSQLINIKHCPFNMSPYKKFSHPGSNKFDDRAIFSPI